MFCLLGSAELESTDVIGYAWWAANSLHHVIMFGKEEEVHFG